MVISPATTARSVVTSVSQATRLVGSCVEAEVEDGVGDLVGHLVRVAHRHGFAGEQDSARSPHSSWLKNPGRAEVRKHPDDSGNIGVLTHLRSPTE